MLESIIGYIREIFATYLQWWFFVNQYQEAIVLRKGRFHRKKTTGLYWKWPFIEEAFHTLIIPTTNELRQQSLITKDGKSVTVRGMVKAKVDDSVKFLTEVYDQTDALGDTTMGVIARIVMDSTLAELTDPAYDINNKITIKARATAKVYGIYVMQVTLIETATTRGLRIFSDSKAVEESKS